MPPNREERIEAAARVLWGYRCDDRPERVAGEAHQMAMMRQWARDVLEVLDVLEALEGLENA